MTSERLKIPTLISQSKNNTIPIANKISPFTLEGFLTNKIAERVFVDIHTK